MAENPRDGQVSRLLEHDGLRLRRLVGPDCWTSSQRLPLAAESTMHTLQHR